MISEQHRYQGVSYKSDISIISGLDLGDRQVLEHKYSGCDPPCLLDSSDGRFVLKGPIYNPCEVMNCLMSRRGYRMQGAPQQRTLPNIHNKDDKFAMIYHLSKDVPLRRSNTISCDSVEPAAQPTAPPTLHHSLSDSATGPGPDTARTMAEYNEKGFAGGELLNAKKLRFSPQPGLKKIQHPYYSQSVEYQSSKM